MATVSSTSAAPASNVLAEIKKGLAALQSGNPRAALAAATAIAMPLVTSGKTEEIRQLAKGITDGVTAQQNVIGASDTEVLTPITLTLPEPSRTLSEEQHTAWTTLNTKKEAINATIGSISGGVTPVQKAELMNLRKEYNAALQAYKSKYISLFGTNAGVKAKDDLAARVNKALAVWNGGFIKPYDVVYAEPSLLSDDIKRQWRELDTSSKAADTAAKAAKAAADEAVVAAATDPTKNKDARDPTKDAAFASAIEDYTKKYDAYKVAVAKAAETYVKGVESNKALGKTLYLTPELKSQRAALINALVKGTAAAADATDYGNAIDAQLGDITHESMLNRARGITSSARTAMGDIAQQKADAEAEAKRTAEAAETKVVAIENRILGAFYDKSALLKTGIKDKRSALVQAYIATADLADDDVNVTEYEEALGTIKDDVSYADKTNAEKRITRKKRAELNYLQQSKDALKQQAEDEKVAMEGLTVVTVPWMPASKEAYKAVEKARKAVIGAYVTNKDKTQDPYKAAVAAYNEAVMAYKNRKSISEAQKAQEKDALEGLEVISAPVLDKQAVAAYTEVQAAYEKVGTTYAAALTADGDPKDNTAYKEARTSYETALKAYKEEFTSSGLIHTSKTAAAEKKQTAATAAAAATASAKAKDLKAAQKARMVGYIPPPPEKGTNPDLADQHAYLTTKYVALLKELQNAKATPENATNIGFKTHLDTYTKMAEAYKAANAKKGDLYKVLTSLSYENLKNVPDFVALKNQAVANNVNPTYIADREQLHNILKKSINLGTLKQATDALAEANRLGVKDDDKRYIVEALDNMVASAIKKLQDMVGSNAPVSKFIEAVNLAKTDNVDVTPVLKEALNAYAIKTTFTDWARLKTLATENSVNTEPAEKLRIAEMNRLQRVAAAARETGGAPKPVAKRDEDEAAAKAANTQLAFLKQRGGARRTHKRLRLHKRKTNRKTHSKNHSV
jgi:hypothetical protein